jgi:hypothetical protein
MPGNTKLKRKGSHENEWAKTAVATPYPTTHISSEYNIHCAKTIVGTEGTLAFGIPTAYEMRDVANCPRQAQTPGLISLHEQIGYS